MKNVYTVQSALTDYFRGSISEWLLRRVLRSGELPHFRIGGRILLTEEALDAWVSKQEVEIRWQEKNSRQTV